MKRIVFASGNKGKIKEVAEILKDVEILSLKDIGFVGEIDETGSTFEENSYIKAKAAFDFCHLPTLAEDTGLCVEALNGAPGIYSARYSGENATDEKNRALLLKNLKNATTRRAKFVTVATFIDEDGSVVTASGETCGHILESEDGENGFGYDRLFFSDDLNKSFGVASDEEKNAVSHRYRAIKNLLEKVKL